MAKTDYVRGKDADFAAQLNAFKLNIDSYATLLGVSAGQVTAQAADADYFNYAFTCNQIVSNTARQWTEWKNITREGGDVPVTGVPVPPELPTSVAAVAPGVELRFRDLVRQIKSNANYNVGIGEALGIEGGTKTGPDFSSFKPMLTLELSGGQVLVRWGWQGYREFLSMLEIHVDRGGGFALLTYDTTPDYLDTQPMPPTAEKWMYKAIYRSGEARIGQWSDVSSLTVGG